MHVAPHLVERFGHALDALAPERRVGVAVSGGPDSLALLLLACAARQGQVAAATVDHGLRAEAADEARFVAGICQQIGCPHTTLAVTVAPGRSVQAEARDARYQALSRWASSNTLAAIATAHHADDQAETLLMRLQRGSGPAGLSGVRPAASLHGALIVRPLLDWRKQELVEIVAAAGLTPVSDPSNRDERFDRTWARALLSSGHGLDPARLARSAGALQEAEAALSWMIDEVAPDRIRGEGETLLIDFAGLPRELRRRLLARAIRCLDPDGAYDSLEPLLTALERGAPATLGRVMVRPGAVWSIGLAPPRRPVRTS